MTTTSILILLLCGGASAEEGPLSPNSGIRDMPIGAIITPATTTPELPSLDKRETDPEPRMAASGNNLFEMLAPSSCPSGMVLAGKAGTESAFCIEANERSSVQYQAAASICASAGKYVCTTNQWYIGSQTSGVNTMCSHNWEWTGSKDHAHSSGHLQISQGGAECTRKTWDWTDQHNNGATARNYRCCFGGISAFFE